MTIKDTLIFDTETTGVPERNASWETDFADYPYVVQLAWMHGTKAESHIIRPDGWEIPTEATDVHGITTEYAREHGEPFADVVELFLADCKGAGLICGHNIHFDTSIIKANILRSFGREWYDSHDVESALYKGKRIDTMRPTMKWVDARMANGRLKFPKLEELYARCFPGETFPAHDALEDVKAVARCLPVIVDMGLVELKRKQYPDEAQTGEIFNGPAKAENDDIAAKMAKDFGTSPEKPRNAPILDANEKDDKLHVESGNAPEIANSPKISELAERLLNQNDF